MAPTGRTAASKNRGHTSISEEVHHDAGVAVGVTGLAALGVEVERHRGEAAVCVADGHHVGPLRRLQRPRLRRAIDLVVLSQVQHPHAAARDGGHHPGAEVVLVEEAPRPTHRPATALGQRAVLERRSRRAARPTRDGEHARPVDSTDRQVRMGRAGATVGGRHRRSTPGSSGLRPGVTLRPAEPATLLGSTGKVQGWKPPSSRARRRGTVVVGPLAGVPRAQWVRHRPGKTRRAQGTRGVDPSTRRSVRRREHWGYCWWR